MNLFVLDEDPTVAAQCLDDKRIGKLLMEANQMLSLAVKHHLNCWDDPEMFGPGRLCAGIAYYNHPVSVWVRINSSTFLWTVCHAYALGREFKHRFGRVHESAARTQFITTFLSCIPKGPLLPFQNSARHGGLGVDFSHLPVPEAYRSYILERWRTDTRPPVFTNREWPSWARSQQ